MYEGETRMKNVLILYGSTTGNTQNVSETIEGILTEKGSDVTVESVSDADSDAIAAADLVLLGCSTWGEGELQEDFIDFYEDMSSDDFSGKNVAVFGCGDSAMFPHVFCEAVKLIEEKVADCGANVLCEGLKVDGDVDDNEDNIIAWAKGLF